MRSLVLLATITVASIVATTVGGLAASPARADAVEDELRAYDQLVKPTADAVAANKCTARDCIASLLATMQGYDQALRRGVVTINAQCERLDAAARKRCTEGVQQRVDTGDRSNADRLKKIIDQVGWPSTSAFGESAEQAAWLIALHADFDRGFQRRVLALLQRSAEQGESPQRHYAYLYDRLAVAEHKPQRWGTQGRCVAAKWEPFPIEDADTVDQRRAEMHMAPMAAYRSSFDPAACNGKN